MFATHSAMLIHLENGCSTNMRELDLHARQCFQWRKYVVEEYADWLENGERDRMAGQLVRASPEYIKRRHCHECNRDFDSEKDFCKHIYSPVHHPLVYKCPGCSSNFSVLSALVQHVESDSCDEGIDDGTGAIGKPLHYLWLKL